MPELVVGYTVITWTASRSPKAKHLSLTVTGDRVEVVVPDRGTEYTDADIEDFVHQKRRWLFNAVREAQGLNGDLVQHYSNGAKLLYRGRRLTLDVQPANVAEVTVTCRSRFHVRVPNGLPDDERPVAVRQALIAWLKERAGRDARSWARVYGKKLGVKPRAVRLGDQRTMWGSCGKDKVIRINWRLVQAPASAMEYVVAHEVVHLVERTHGPGFWEALGQVVGDWPDRKALLERWEREQRIQARQV